MVDAGSSCAVLKCLLTKVTRPDCVQHIKPPFAMPTQQVGCRNKDCPFALIAATAALEAIEARGIDGQRVLQLQWVLTTVAMF